MVPVGGAIIAGFDDSFIKEISKMYPGMHIFFKQQTCCRWVICYKLNVWSQTFAESEIQEKKINKNTAIPLKYAIPLNILNI